MSDFDPIAPYTLEGRVHRIEERLEALGQAIKLLAENDTEIATMVQDVSLACRHALVRLGRIDHTADPVVPADALEPDAAGEPKAFRERDVERDAADREWDRFQKYER